MKFWDNVGDPQYFPTPLPVVYITFRSTDIRHQVSKSSKNRTHVNIFGLLIYGREDPNFSTADC